MRYSRYSMILLIVLLVFRVILGLYLDGKPALQDLYLHTTAWTLPLAIALAISCRTSSRTKKYLSTILMSVYGIYLLKFYILDDRPTGVSIFVVSFTMIACWLHCFTCIMTKFETFSIINSSKLKWLAFLGYLLLIFSILMPLKHNTLDQQSALKFTYVILFVYSFIFIFIYYCMKYYLVKQNKMNNANFPLILSTSIGSLGGYLTIFWYRGFIELITGDDYVGFLGAFLRLITTLPFPLIFTAGLFYAVVDIQRSIYMSKGDQNYES